MFILIVFVLSCEKNPNKLFLPRLFSDGMVLQRNTETSIWGKTVPNQNVKLIGSWGSEMSTNSDFKGSWEVYLNTQDAGGPHSITVLSGEDTLIINNVLIGEVWLASGQSNMEMPLKGWLPNNPVLNSDQVIAEAVYHNIRMFSVEKNFSITPINYLGGRWIPTSIETAGDFSATAYFFALKLRQELDMPIGIIHSSWGGTPAEAWTSESKLKDLGYFIKILDSIKDPEMEELSKEWFLQWPTIELPRKNIEWEDLNLFDSRVSDIDLDDTYWDKTMLPGRFDNLISEEFDGAVWFRKNFEIIDNTSDYILRIGSIDDMDKIFINGINIGGLSGYGFYNTPRAVPVLSSILNKGMNAIAIRAIDTGGPGSFNGPMTLSNNSGEVISIEGEWKYRPIAEIYMDKFFIYHLNTDLSKRPIHSKLNPKLPSVVFNGMINPLIPYSIKGVIWYQGEANVGRDEQYKSLFPGMISDWRDKWDKDFPFYFVQIAPFKYSSRNHVSQKLRDAQRQALKVPNTGMVVTLDIGDPKNIHPANKQEVGIRLAKLALANDYGFKLIFSGPLYSHYEIIGNKVKINFDHIGKGLVIKENINHGFEIAGANKKYTIADVIVNKDNVVLSSKRLKHPKHVRYAWSDTVSATLYNLEGLPASSFTTELE